VQREADLPGVSVDTPVALDTLPTDLRELAVAWAALPEAAKAGIVAMVRAASGSR